MSSDSTHRRLPVDKEELAPLLFDAWEEGWFQQEGMEKRTWSSSTDYCRGRWEIVAAVLLGQVTVQPRQFPNHSAPEWLPAPCFQHPAEDNAQEIVGSLQCALRLVESLPKLISGFPAYPDAPDALLKPVWVALSALKESMDYESTGTWTAVSNWEKAMAIAYVRAFAAL
jgi:hypothetical protein